MPEAGPQYGVGAAFGAIAEAIEAEEGPMTDRKRRIVEAALTCFAEQGFEATSTAEIARLADVAEATIFRHFRTKKDLLIRLVRPVAGRLLIPAAIDELEAIKAASGGRFAEIARAVMMSRIRFVDRYAPLVRIVVQELPLQPELRELLFSDSLRPGLDLLYRTLGELVAAGEIRADIPPDRMFRWFGSLLIGYYVVRSILPPGAYDDEAEIAATVDFMIRGAAPR